MPVNKTGEKTICKNCGYTWLTKSKNFYVPCPRCHHQNKLEHNIKKTTTNKKDHRKNDYNKD